MNTKPTACMRVMIFCLLSLIGLPLWLGENPALARDRQRPAYFLDEERRIIQKYYLQRKTPAKGLPPGLAKKGALPPGLQKYLAKNGQLPPGLQKRIEPLPVDLDRRLPSLPEFWERVIVERSVILIDRRTNRILDIIENIVALATE